MWSDIPRDGQLIDLTVLAYAVLLRASVEESTLA